MTIRVLYRVAAVLILLFDVGHTAGVPWSDPAWGAAPAVMQSGHFRVFGFTRTYWNFYVGFGLFISVFLLFAAIVAWQLGSLPPPGRALMSVTAWALALAFAAVSVLSVIYFFMIPILFSFAITVCLVGAASLNRPGA
ncbi:MAG TPA: hypothetical protein VKG23_07390 [Thermoanaerobaculia bacterium]|nr:hypothetical protein [Thermoanaerobaculia bacterium]